VVPLASEDVKAFAHGPLQGSVFVPDGETVVLDFRDLKSGQFVEASIVLPAPAVPFVGPPSGPVVGPNPPDTVTSAGEVLAAEARLADAANRRRSLNDLLLGATKVVAIAFLPFLIWMIVLAFRRDRVPDVPKLLQEPPENAHPAELALLWSAYRGTFAPKDAYRAQLLSLAQKGVIGVVAEGQVSNPKDLQIRLLKEPTDRLDREFVEFLFDADAGPLPGPTQAPVKLSDAVKARGGRTAALTGWWKYAAAKARGPIERIKDGQTRMESVLAFLFAAAVAAGGYFTATYLGIRGGLFLIPFALVGWIVATRIIPARLPTDLRTRLAKWRAFRRFLTQFQGLADAPALAVIIWERYLVYATALGVAETVTKQIRALIPEGSLPAPWPGALPGSTGYLWASHFSSGAPAHAAVSTSASVAGQITWSGSWGSSSGGGGGGGGSSGGGGGGGGGSGGGAG
jgi:uncharacterized membrane protein